MGIRIRVQFKTISQWEPFTKSNLDLVIIDEQSVYLMKGTVQSG